VDAKSGRPERLLSRLVHLEGVLPQWVAQTSKSAVSQVSKPAQGECAQFDGLPTWMSAIQQVWKPALRLGNPPSTGHPWERRHPCRELSRARTRWVHNCAPPARMPALVRLRVAQSKRWKSASGRSSPPVTEGTARERLPRGEQRKVNG
jgi:hypothetical protein